MRAAPAIDAPVAGLPWALRANGISTKSLSRRRQSARGDQFEIALHQCAAQFFGYRSNGRSSFSTSLSFVARYNTASIKRKMYSTSDCASAFSPATLIETHYSHQPRPLIFLSGAHQSIPLVALVTCAGALHPGPYGKRFALSAHIFRNVCTVSTVLKNCFTHHSSQTCQHGIGVRFSMVRRIACAVIASSSFSSTYGSPYRAQSFAFLETVTESCLCLLTSREARSFALFQLMPHTQAFSQTFA